MRTLIIGAHTRGIGDAVVGELVENQASGDDEILCPDITAFDVRSPSSMSGWFSEHGPMDQVVFAAGFNRLAWIAELSERDLLKTFDVNVIGFISMLTEHTKRFPDHKVRCVVIVSDAAAHPMRSSIAYCSSKAALLMAVKTAARELFPVWTLVSVSPGVVEDTPITKYIDETVPGMRGWTPEEAAAYEAKNSSLGRRVKKAEVAATVRFALEGPESLNGSDIIINGSGI